MNLCAAPKLKSLLLIFLLLKTSQALFSQELREVNLSDISQDTSAFTKVDVVASTDHEEWRKHLTTSLYTVIDSAAKVLKSGRYTVHVRFIVEKDGRITNVKPLNDPGFGIGKLVADVILQGPKWKPGLMNNRPVRTYFTQPVTFVIQE